MTARVRARVSTTSVLLSSGCAGAPTETHEGRMQRPTGERLVCVAAISRVLIRGTSNDIVLA